MCREYVYTRVLYLYYEANAFPLTEKCPLVIAFNDCIVALCSDNMSSSNMPYIVLLENKRLRLHNEVCQSVI